MERVISGRRPWDSEETIRDSSAYEDLAASIVLQAVKDYIKDIRKMWNPKLSLRTKRRAILEWFTTAAFGRRNRKRKRSGNRTGRK